MSALVIANTQIRKDAAGRYCLNDLHQASGGAKRHQPGDWLRLKQTQELVAEILADPVAVPGIPGTEALLTPEEREPVVVLQGGFVQGTYAVKELVYAYAMWISAAFHLHVIRAYDALVTQRVAEASTPLLSQPQHRADQLVSAGRIFSAALRTGRQLRLPPRRAMQAAFDCARRHTGIDWSEELDVQPMLVADDPADPLEATVAEHLAGIHSFESPALIRELGLGDPKDTVLCRRVCQIARTRGWRPRRTALGGVFRTLWEPRL